LPQTRRGIRPRSKQSASCGQKPRIDGLLDDAVWAGAAVTGDFWQRDPVEGSATESTEVRVLYDQDSIYFGVRCNDSQPRLIRATELRRDDTLENDDSFSLLLDTFLDHRNAKLFRTNPLGTQYDALITEEGNDLNKEWDEIWSSEARDRRQGLDRRNPDPLHQPAGPATRSRTGG